MNTSRRRTHLALTLSVLTVVGALLSLPAPVLGRSLADYFTQALQAMRAVLGHPTRTLPPLAGTPPDTPKDWRRFVNATAEATLPPCDKPQKSAQEFSRCRVNPVQAPGEAASAPSAPRAAAALLYDQTDNASENGAPDQDFEASFDTYDSEAADDFVVPVGQVWAVNRVDTVGTTGSPGGATVDVTIYADAPGGGDPNLPGAAVCTYADIVPTDTLGSFSIMLPTPCKLAQGAYWVGIQTNQNFGSHGQHFWSNRSVQTGSEGVWRNPGNGFATGCTTFTPQTVCGVGGGVSPDFLFQIHGVICPTITINPAVLPTGIVGAPYPATVFTQTGGAAPAAFALSGALPTGMTFNAGTATLSGAPMQFGGFPITVMATDANGCMGATNYTLMINALPPPDSSKLEKLNPDDPLLCAGGVVNGAIGQTNTTPGALPGRVFTTLQNLIVTPGSIVCTLTPAAGGATTFCGIENGAPTWRGTLAAGQRVEVAYQAQIPDGVATQACSTASSQFPDGTGVVQATAPFCLSINCPGTPGPGQPPDARSIINDQKAGSVLIYNIYTSSIDPAQQNTRINITNTSTTSPIFVHFFFVDGGACAVADNYLCLTANQTASFLASDLDPGTTGYLVAVATDANGCPTVFNHLLGDEYVKFASGHAANLGAEAVAAIPGGLTFCDPGSDTALLRFDGINYNALPHVVAADNVPSRLDGNDTLLILNRLGGSLVTGAATLGTVVGILYDDAENALSFSFTAGTCQARGSFSNSFPRTAPRFETFIPAGRSGWLKLYAPPLLGVSGAVINANARADGFSQGHNLHKLTLTNAMVYTIPVFPPTC